MRESRSFPQLPVWTFLLVATFLCGQFYFSIRLEEPYPCIRLPGFGSIPGDDSTVVTTRYNMLIELQNDKDTLINCRKNFPSIPQWYVPYAMNAILIADTTNLKQQAVTEEELKHWLEEQLKDVLRLTDIRKVTILKEQVGFEKKTRKINHTSVVENRSFLFTSKNE